ncbi:MAG: molybdenum ABC transporter ATP-binding protein [Gammaproteobacteria bacterium]|nr:molybdenum ABC transporter ATP-binding protein [Gammaproteobacteria bacterium]
MSIEARFTISYNKFLLDVELHIPASGVTAIFGASGCGKTTVLRLMAGLIRTANGYLKVDDDIWQQDDVFVAPHCRAIGYVFQEANLFPHLNVRGNLEYGLKRVPLNARQLAFNDAVNLLGLSSLLERNPVNLSGGERQRVAIARALLTSPRLLLMDEPLSALDDASKNDILPFLERLHIELEIPVIYVSHSREEVARLADYLVLMEAGRVQATGPIAEMLTRVDLPFAHGDEAESIIEATVAGFDDEFNLTLLDFPGGRFCVSRKSVAIGQQVRLQILARDVSLTLEQQSGTSILNILQAKVLELSAEGVAQVMVKLDVGGVPVLSRITRKSAQGLDLHPGKNIFAQIKSVALLT